MPKTATDPIRLEGATMGTRWRVRVDGTVDNLTDLQAALQAEVDRVNAEMSTWTPHSDLMRLNAAPVEIWVNLPKDLISVLVAGLYISRLTDGAFEFNVGAPVRAWGFSGTEGPQLAAIQAASAAPRISALAALEVDAERGRARKLAPLTLDLSGIAKGYAVDLLAAVLTAQGHDHALCEIDGEVRVTGPRRDGAPWAVALEQPDASGSARSMIGMERGALATSGDYRHFVTVRGARLSHTIDPRRGSPLVAAPASVTVMAESCHLADAMATALMVMGAGPGLALARKLGLSALVLTRHGDDLRTEGCGVFDQAD